MKQCNRCKIEKLFNEFHSHRQTRDGYNTSCKVCVALDAKEWAQNNPKKRAEIAKRYAKANPERKAYTRQKSQAKQRGIPFLLSIEEWINWWGEDFENRGRTANELVMARFEDRGPYALDNIKKITHSENVKEEARYLRG